MTTPTPNTNDPMAALDQWTAYWRGETAGPVFTAVTEPTYRQALDVVNPDRDADDGVVPTVYCDFGTISTAKLYGGAVIPPPEGGSVHIEPVASSPADLAALRACAFEESDFQLAVDLWNKVCERLGTDEVYLRTPDFQGPMNTLALVMDQQELLIGMYTEADAIHAALESITTTLIEYHQRLRRELGGGRVVGSIWPDRKSTRLNSSHYS
mgnify:CR=1 FL=1